MLKTKVIAAAAALALVTTSVAGNEDLPSTLTHTAEYLLECMLRDAPEDVKECIDEVERASPNWQILTETDLITDKLSVTMVRPFSGGQGVAHIKPNLMLTCQAGQIMMLISGDFQASATVDVIVRVDGGALHSSTWLAGQDGGRIFTTDMAEISPLIGAEIAVFRFKREDGKTATAKFDVSGLDEASRWFEKYCDTWRPVTSSPE